MRRRAFIAGAAWATPTILLAKPSGAATLSFPPGSHPAAQTPAPAVTQKPLAFTGDNSEQDALVAAGLIGAGWMLTRWATDRRSLPR